MTWRRSHSAVKMYLRSVALIGLVGLFVCFAGLVAYAWMNPLRLHGRPKWSEAKSNLQAFVRAESDFRMATGRYSRFADELGFNLLRGNRYTYFLASYGSRESRANSVIPSLRGITTIETDQFMHRGRLWSPATVQESGCPISATRLDGKAMEFGVVEQGPNAGFLVLAAAQLGEANTPMDCWTISSETRVAKDGTGIPAGEPYCEQEGWARRKSWWQW